MTRMTAAVALATCVLIGSGCATGGAPRANSEGGTYRVQTAVRVPPFTGKIYSYSEMRRETPGAILGDNSYAEVNSAWLVQFYPTFRQQLHRIGVVDWDHRFDCNRFADFYSNLAQAYFAREMYHSRSNVQALALGPYWYVRANGQGRHAIVQAMTERGRVFIDPQTGMELQLTPQEMMSAYVQMF